MKTITTLRNSGGPDVFKQEKEEMEILSSSHSQKAAEEKDPPPNPDGCVSKLDV